MLPICNLEIKINMHITTRAEKRQTIEDAPSEFPAPCLCFRFDFVLGLGSGDLRLLGAPRWKGRHLEWDRGERADLWSLVIPTITQKKGQLSLLLQVRNASKVTCIPRIAE